MGDNSPEKKSGCGLLNAVFGRRWPRRTTSTSSLPGMGSLPTGNNKGSSNNLQKIPSTPSSKRRRNSADESTFAENGMNFQEAAQHSKSITKSPANNPKPPPVNQQQLQQQQQQKQKQQQSYGRRNEQAAAATNNNKMNPSQGYVNQGRRGPKDAIGISGELEMMIADHQKNKGSSGLVRASSGNVMLYSNLGNLRQPGGGGGNSNPYDHINNHLPNAKPGREESYAGPNKNSNTKYPNSVMGNVVKKQNDNHHKPAAVTAEPSSLCRALSTRMDPETLKIMGNEDYKAGNFAEALALYDAAISIDPNKASYRSNKSAALTALGRLLEAVFECREAIRIEPQYHRAHHRLANLYLRLGEVEKAIYHYKHAGPEADQVDIAKAKSVQVHLHKCTDAKRTRDWNTLIKETRAAISTGADSAPQIYALQAEALLKLHKHQDADETLNDGPNFDVDDCTKFLGPISNASLLVVRAQVNLAAGRFEDALVAVEKAANLDSNNKEVNTVMRRARAAAAARSNGNELFKQAKFSEASNAYGEGLQIDPYNSVLLCNRAACRSKLGQYEKAVEDCSAALNLRPNYSKARLRRADCLAKMEKWEASIQDYEILRRLSPDDEEVNEALQEVQAQLKNKRGGA